MNRKEQFAKWRETITYGDGKQYAKFIAWLFLDSTQAYEQKPFWILVGILAVQTIVYALVRRKSYLDICVGHVSLQQNEKLRIGDKLKTCLWVSLQTTTQGSFQRFLCATVRR